MLAREREGTRFHPGPARHSSFKLWLRYAKPSHGVLIVDAGAARALREDGTSLLPVGIKEVRGSFQAGDAVDIAEYAPPPPNPDVELSGTGPLLGKGICSYSADELSRVKGLKSKDVQEIMPRATEEAVHRDYMVLV